MINYYYLNVLHIKINELSICFNDKMSMFRFNV